jgi:hypothetical protein
MTTQQFIFALITSLIFLVFIVWLIQKGKLNIAFCWIWLGIGIILPLITLKYDFLEWITKLIGAATPTTTLFIGAILFLFMLSIQFSMIMSSQRRQIKILAQQMAMLRKEE